MVLSVIKKYTKIYLILCKYAFINTTAYPAAFLTELIVEIGYTAINILLFTVIYANIQSIGGWSYNEMIVFLGINLITSEIILGAFVIFNLSQLPRNIKDGNIDIALTKPFNALFNFSVARPYFMSFISIVPGFFIVIYGLTRLGIIPSLANVLAAILLMFFGIICAYSFIVIFSALSFTFIGSKNIVHLGNNIITNFKTYPHQIFTGFYRILFYFIVPVVFITSIPAQAFLYGIEFEFIAIGGTLAIVFLAIAINFWNFMIKRYSSASS